MSNQFTDGDSRLEFTMGYEVPGTVLLAKQLDWETQKIYFLIIQITDGVHIIYAKVNKLTTVYCILNTFKLKQHF